MDGPIRVATIAALIWGVAGFVVGDVIAWQLAVPALNLDLPWTSFGRLRPLHTSAVIFAFGGNALIATSLYVVQRTCRAARLMAAAERRPGAGRRPRVAVAVHGRRYQPNGGRCRLPRGRAQSRTGSGGGSPRCSPHGS
jgi:hypothetical protein